MKRAQLDAARQDDGRPRQGGRCAPLKMHPRLQGQFRPALTMRFDVTTAPGLSIS